jgi:hypothetical protein
MADQKHRDVTVVLKRTLDLPTPDQLLWLAIRNRTNAISFNRYKRFIDESSTSAMYHPAMDTADIIQQLKAERDRIDAAIAALSETLGKFSGGAPTSGRRRKKRVLSAEARKRIGDAQRRRWSKQKASK